MLEVQKYLQDNSLEDLKQDFDIKTTHHEDGRVILNYNQLASKSIKFHPIVRECRGLVLDKNNELVARSFYRFYNLGEHPEEQQKFDWQNSHATDKEDGSLILIYYWNGDWHINTRGSFGNGLLQTGNKTWRWLVNHALPDNIFISLDPELIYVGEICSRYNKVVRDYKSPTYFLLSIFNGEQEFDFADTIYIANQFKLRMPDIHEFNSEQEVELYLEEKGKEDKTYEGIVLRDNQDLRIKCKSSEYVRLHRLSNNGNIAHPKNLIKFVLKHEEDEVLTYFPELRDQVNEIKNILNKAWQQIDNIWYCHYNESSQKKFALAVKDHPLSAILFNARKLKCHPKDLWVESEELFLKKLFK